jgi:cytoskeletal protein CcmA (bactofilin family)
MAVSNEPFSEPTSILGPSLRFKGELKADEDLMIRGHVEGSITHSQRLTVCRDGHVKANIQGQVIAVEGTVEGDLTATTSVAVMDSACLTGDVSAPSVSIVEGAKFNGNVLMPPDSGKAAQSLRRSDGRPAPSTEPARITGTR